MTEKSACHEISIDEEQQIHRCEFLRNPTVSEFTYEIIIDYYMETL